MSDCLRVHTLLGSAGVFVEPSCAAAYVGLVKARQMRLIAPDEEVVLQLTGSGFKDLRAVLRAAGQPIPIRSLADVHP